MDPLVKASPRAGSPDLATQLLWSLCLFCGLIPTEHLASGGDSSNSSFGSDAENLGVRNRWAGSRELFTFPKPPLLFPLSLSTPALQIAVTFAIVLGVIIYRISTAAALAMNSSPSVRSNIRVTVTATAVIINLVVIILLDEVYGCIARWLTKIGEY